MKERLAAIDVSSIEELQRIKTDQDVILQRLEMLEDKKDSVSEEVYSRVHLDYEGRMTSLEEQAGPLKGQAREQFAELKVVLEEIEGAANTAEMDREEIQLRHDLGEFSEEEFAEHQTTHEARVAEHRSDLEEAQALRDRFLSAFHSEDELEIGPPDASSETVEEEVEEAEFETNGAGEIPAIPEPPVEPPPIPVEGEEVFGDPDFEPEFGSVPAMEVDEVAPLEMDPEEVPEAPTSEPDGATMILKWPTLIMQTENGDFEEHSVMGGSTVLGSDPDCEITIVGTKVGQRHAEISMDELGYVVRNLDETVGTLVNGVEIIDWNLSDGDSIQIGELILVFKEA